MQFSVEEIEHAEWMIIAGVERDLSPVAQKQRPSAMQTKKENEV